MASSIPAQTRTVDPYASYNSNVVNQLTGIVTRGSDGLDIDNALQVIPDSTSSADHVTVLPGIVYKDDMLIEIISQHRVDFTDITQYIGNPFPSQDGIHYIVLEYTYAKSRPAPQAQIKILLPDQTSSFRAGSFPSLFFLKAVDYTAGVIGTLSDYDPSYPTAKREYLKKYAGTEAILPTFDQERDQSRIIYVPEDDEFYFGYETEWGSAGGGTTGGSTTYDADTSGFNVGDIVYKTPGGNLALAIGPFPYSTADGVVTTVSATEGKVTVAGLVTNVPIQSGASVSVGTILYLSESTAGTVTDQRSAPTWQFVGRCVSTDSTTADMLFVRGEPSGTEGVSYGVSSGGSVSGGSWLPSGSSVYQDVDISGFEEDKVLVTVWDATTFFKVEPVDIEFVSSSVLRIWMPGSFTGDLGFLCVGPSATTASTGSIQKVVDDLSGVDWISSGGRYYGVVDTSTIELSQGSIVKCYNSSNEEIYPDDIEYDSTGVLHIWMPVNTELVRVVAVGPTASETAISTRSVDLASGGSWFASGGAYFQDIVITPLGSDDVVFEIKDASTLDVIHATVTIPVSGTMRVWMPVNTTALEVTVVG